MANTSLETVLERLNAVKDTMTVERVFGDAYERDGVTVIPVSERSVAEGVAAAAKAPTTSPSWNPRPTALGVTPSRWFGPKTSCMASMPAGFPAPPGISLEQLRQQGYTHMPEHGWIPVNVPGVPAAWAALSERFGQLPLTAVLEPAIRYSGGYPVSPVVAHNWQKAFPAQKPKLKRRSVSALV